MSTGFMTDRQYKRRAALACALLLEAEARKEALVAKKSLKEMRDELRVRIHLAEMDARSTWEKLQPKLHELQRKASRAGAVAEAEIEAALKRLRSSLRSLRDQLESPRT
jgi:hypothetical protein